MLFFLRLMFSVLCNLQATKRLFSIAPIRTVDLWCSNRPYDHQIFKNFATSFSSLDLTLKNLPLLYQKFDI